MQSEKIASIFVGLEEAYGTYEIHKTQSNGKNTGKARIIRDPRTSETWEGHLSGEGHSVGIIPINSSNQVKWGCIDVDQYNFNHKELIDRIKDLKLPLVVCRSKSGGAHIFLFCKEWIEAKEMQDTLNTISAGLGYSGSEIFPKQIRLNLERGDIGNFLNMPYYNMERGLRYAIKEDGTAASLEEFFKLFDDNVQTPEQIQALSIDKTEDTPVIDGPPCLQTLCSQGFPDGTRNNGLFNCGVYLRKAFPDTWQEELVSYNMKYMNPPLPLSEVNVIVRQLQRKDYAYKCSDAPINEYCDKTKCLTRRFGVGNAVANATIANLRKYNSNPPVWFMDVNGEPLELDTEGLMSQASFQRSCVDQLNFMPPTVSKPVWENRVGSLLRDMTETEGGIMEASEDASINGAFYEYLEDFCRNMQTASNKEEILLRRPWTDEEEGNTYFRLRDFENYLKRNRFFDFKTHKIAQRLRDINGENCPLRLKGRVVRVWKIPSFLAPDTDVPIPNFTEDNDVPF